MTDSPHSTQAHRNELGGRVALVTGSSRGIGRAIAAELARRGAAVAVHGRDEAAVRAAAAAIAAGGGQVIAVTGDVTRAADLDAIQAQVQDRLGPVDIVVANAGGNLAPPGAAVEDITEQAWRATVDANLTATFLTLRAFLPGMKARGRGAVVTMASSAGRRADGRAPVAYAAAKAAIVMLTQTAAAQAGPAGVRVNCLAPGTILTERTRELIPAAQQDAMAGFHPLRRLGVPADVAAAAAFLASDQAAWLTGQVIDLTGGTVMT